MSSHEAVQWHTFLLLIRLNFPHAITLGGSFGDTDSTQMSAIDYVLGFWAAMILPLNPKSIYLFPGITEQPGIRGSYYDHVGS